MMDQLGSAAMLRAEFVRQNGTIRHTQTLPVLDGELKVGGKAVPLSKISLIVPSRGMLRGNDGVELVGQLEGLDAFQQFISTLGFCVPIDLCPGQHMRAEYPQVVVVEVAYADPMRIVMPAIFAIDPIQVIVDDRINDRLVEGESECFTTSMVQYPK